MTDFERAAFIAFQQIFPQSRTHGCFFYLTQCIWRCIQASGLQQQYQTDPEFELKCKMIPSLAFLPPDATEEKFEDVTNPQTGIWPPELQPILNYFEDNFTGRPNRRGDRRQTPLFPIKQWNVHQCVLDH